MVKTPPAKFPLTPEGNPSTISEVGAEIPAPVASVTL